MPDPSPTPGASRSGVTAVPVTVPASPAVDLASERTALARARAAVQAKLTALGAIAGGGADALADEYIAAVVAGAVERMQQELVVFGRIDDGAAWRIGLYGIDEGGDQLVVDWRAPFATAFYQASFDEPRGLDRRVTYVGSIQDLFVEDFGRGEVTGSSPLLGELSRSKGGTMRAAVATLQSEQDALVRLPPTERLVLRGGPGTGKTVVGLHRAAWLVYNDDRLTAGRILVVGPSDRFLRFVATVLPTLGEARVVQTTFDRLLGPSTAAGSDERWLGLLDAFEADLIRPAAVRVGRRRFTEEEITALAEPVVGRPLAWRDRRKAFVAGVARAAGFEGPVGEVTRAVAEVWPAMSTRQAWAKLRSRAMLLRLGADAEWVDAWLADPNDGALHDEVRARFEGTPAAYGHVILDEAQDTSLLQLRAAMRRSPGLSLVGDDAQRSTPWGIGLRRAATELGVEPATMATAYRMSAEIAEWINDHARRHAIDAVELIGIRPTGVPVRTVASVETGRADLASHWDEVAVITAADAWVHKGVEYDAVVVDTTGMTPEQIYLAASRAAHELVVVTTD